MKTLVSLVAFLTAAFFCLDAHGFCKVTASSVNFGSYDAFRNTPVDSRGSVTIECDEAPPPTVTILLSASSTTGGFSPRAMKQVNGPDVLYYNLYTDSTMSSVWGDGTSGTAPVVQPKVKKNDPPRVVPVYGRIAPGQNVSVGEYLDALTVTVTW